MTHRTNANLSGNEDNNIPDSEEVRKKEIQTYIHIHMYMYVLNTCNTYRKNHNTTRLYNLLYQFYVCMVIKYITGETKCSGTTVDSNLHT